MSHMIKCHLCSLQVSVSSEVFAKRISGKKVSLRCKQCRGLITIDGTDAQKPVVVPPGSPAPVEQVALEPSTVTAVADVNPSKPATPAPAPAPAAEPSSVTDLPVAVPATPPVAPLAAPTTGLRSVRPAPSVPRLAPRRVASSPVIPAVRNVPAAAPPSAAIPAPKAVKSPSAGKRNATLLGLQGSLPPPRPAPVAAGPTPAPAEDSSAAIQAASSADLPALAPPTAAEPASRVLASAPTEYPAPLALAPAVEVLRAAAVPEPISEAVPTVPLAPALAEPTQAELRLPEPPLPAVPPAAPAQLVAGELTPASFELPESAAPRPRSRVGIVLFAAATLLGAGGIGFLAQRGQLAPWVARLTGSAPAAAPAQRAASARVTPPPAPAEATPAVAQPPRAPAAEAAPAAAPEAAVAPEAPVPAADEPAAPSEAEAPAAAPVSAADAEVPPYVARPAAVLHLTHLSVRNAENCHRGGRAVGTAQAFVTFEPDGKVSDVRLEGEPIASAPVSRCVKEQLRATRVAKFDGPAFTLQRQITLR